mmetsp:Transcript_104297/g.293622  ORF Transcript_104297/g.293622 Transcript_104297/m.293622 type:complete len:482 (+) Transcript_104297:1-1446(+)
MPTFQIYLHKKKIFEFSGADEGGLSHYTTSAVEQAVGHGTFVGLEVTREALEDFYRKHEPEKVPQAASLAQKYSSKTAVLMRVSREKYGEAPRTSKRRSASDEAAGAGTSAASGGAGVGTAQQATKISDRPVEDLRGELAQLNAELERRGVQESSAAEEEEEFPFLSAEDVAAEGVHKVIIIGGGPAGLAAATYASRAGLVPLVVAPAFGGQLLGKGVDVENFPGVVGEYATGRGLVELMRRQSHSFGARFVSTAVLGVDFSKRPFRINVNGTSREMRAEAIILACGAESRWLQVEGEHTFRGNGISACATCDGFLFRGKDVAVVGGGDHAMEDALHLARTSRKVTIIHRRDAFRASRVLADKVLNHSSITVRWNTEVQSFSGKDALTHLTLRTGDAKPERFDVAGAFVAIGHEPQTGFLQGHVELDESGYVALKGRTSTSVRGVFAAGDVADRVYRQAITASGTGAQAALDVEKFLNEGA